MIKALIFDLDGTLVDLPINYDSLFRQFKEIMHVKNVRPVAEVVAKTDPATRQKVFEVWDQEEMESVVGVSLHESGMQLYQKYGNLPKALVTLQGRRATDIVIYKYKLAFNAVFTRENALSRIEQMKSAQKILKTDFQDILFVGDSDNDEKAAKALGCQFLKIS